MVLSRAFLQATANGKRNRDGRRMVLVVVGIKLHWAVAKVIVHTTCSCDFKVLLELWENHGLEMICLDL